MGELPFETECLRIVDPFFIKLAMAGIMFTGDKDIEIIGSVISNEKDLPKKIGPICEIAASNDNEVEISMNGLNMRKKIFAPRLYKGVTDTGFLEVRSVQSYFREKKIAFQLSDCSYYTFYFHKDSLRLSKELVKPATIKEYKKATELIGYFISSAIFK